MTHKLAGKRKSRFPVNLYPRKNAFLIGSQTALSQDGGPIEVLLPSQVAHEQEAVLLGDAADDPEPDRETQKLKGLVSLCVQVLIMAGLQGPRPNARLNINNKD